MNEPADMGGARVVVTRPRIRAKQLVQMLLRYGAEPITASTIQIDPLPLSPDGQQAVLRVGAYDWIAFSSANAVRHFVRVMQELSRGTDALAACRVAAVGPGTAAAVQELDMTVSAMPERYIAEALSDALGDVAGLRILLPRALQARSVLPDMLMQMGARVDVVPVYSTQAITPTRRAIAELRRGYDAVTFTSPSAVRSFARLTRDEALHHDDRATVACIGPETARVAEREGFFVDVVPEVYTLGAMVQSMASYRSRSELRVAASAA